MLIQFTLGHDSNQLRVWSLISVPSFNTPPNTPWLWPFVANMADNVQLSDIFPAEHPGVSLQPAEREFRGFWQGGGTKVRVTPEIP